MIVGGTSAIPKLQAAFRNVFSAEQLQSLGMSATEVNAFGALYEAQIRFNNASDASANGAVLAHDIFIHSDNVKHKVLRQGQKLPCSRAIPSELKQSIQFLECPHLGLCLVLCRVDANSDANQSRLVGTVELEGDETISAISIDAAGHVKLLDGILGKVSIINA
jgi:molecular chaperone DnaK (HSP70)